jgi:hypothetical protein
MGFAIAGRNDDQGTARDVTGVLGFELAADVCRDPHDIFHHRGRILELSSGGSKPATGGHFKTGQSEASDS